MTGAPILSSRNVGKSFGAFSAVSAVDLDVMPGETLGLIGPNGAGKTTFFNMLTGFVLPDNGSVLYLEQDITHLPVEQRVARGLVRTFQKSLIFPGLSIRENVALAVRAQNKTGYRWWRSAASLREADELAASLIERSGLARRGGELACNVSHGEQRIVDVLLAIALQPRLLLLDEPTAGLARAEADQVLNMIRHHDLRTAVLMIAHDLDIVFSVCDRIAVLNLGRLIAVDSPEAIRINPEVRTAYLGELAT